MASTEVFLSLLAPPTRALVSAAVGSGTVAYYLSSPAHCFIARVPYDEDVFYEGRPQPSLGAVDISSSFKPRRPVGDLAFRKLVTPQNLALTGARNVGLSVLLVVNRYIGQLQDAEEDAMLNDQEPIYPPFPWTDVENGVHRGCINACLDYATQWIRSLYDLLAVYKLPLEISNRLRKELRPSVARKIKYPYYERGLRVVRTSLLSEATLYAADWTVACCVEMYNMIVTANKVTWSRVRLLCLRCGLHSIRCSLVLLTVSVGNGVGSTSPYARNLAMFVLGQIASFLVNSYMHRVIAGFSTTGTGDGSPASDATGAGGDGSSLGFVEPWNDSMLQPVDSFADAAAEIAMATAAAVDHNMQPQRQGEEGKQAPRGLSSGLPQRPRQKRSAPAV